MRPGARVDDSGMVRSAGVIGGIYLPRSGCSGVVCGGLGVSLRSHRLINCATPHSIGYSVWDREIMTCRSFRAGAVHSLLRGSEDPLNSGNTDNFTASVTCSGHPVPPGGESTEVVVAGVRVRDRRGTGVMQRVQPELMPVRGKPYSVEVIIRTVVRATLSGERGSPTRRNTLRCTAVQWPSQIREGDI